MGKNTKIKFDFNLLMSGTWVLDNREEEKIFKFEKEVGEGKIIIYNPVDVPSPKDSKLLDYLMLKAQEQDWSNIVILPTLSQICKDLNIPKSKKTVERLKKSFEILSLTRIQFHNCFIDNGILEHFEEGQWQIISIGIINDYGFLPVRGRGNPIQVKVIFDKNFISVCKYSLGYKLVPYAPIQGLRDTAYALYKWAWRWFNAEKGYGERWIGNGKKLVEWYKNELNSTAKYKYPSKVLERIKSAIEQLNNNSEVPFYLQLKEENGYKIEIYRKDQCTLKREIPFDKLPAILKKTVIKLIEQYKNHIKEPYAFARSMSWKELEDLLKKVVIIPISQDTWDFLEFSMQKSRNEREKMELQQTILSTEKKENGEVYIAVEKSKLKKNNILYKLLDFLTPNWRTFIQNAVGHAKEKEIVT
jgi:hypothetical protein